MQVITAQAGPRAYQVIVHHNDTYFLWQTSDHPLIAACAAALLNKRLHDLGPHSLSLFCLPELIPTTDRNGRPKYTRSVQ